MNKTCEKCQVVYQGHTSSKFCYECRIIARKEIKQRWFDKHLKKTIVIDDIEKLEGEVFKQVISNPNYYISNKGRVLSKNGFMKPILGNKGYYYVSLCQNSKHTHHTLHRLLATHFIPNDDESKTLIDHINRDRTDNRLENLRWVDCKENANNTSKIKKGSICLDKSSYRTFYYVDGVKHSKRFKTYQEATEYLDMMLLP